MDRLDGKVTLVTGAAQGIGRGIAEALHAEGAVVVATDVLDVDLEVEDTHRLDVTDEDRWDEVVRAVEDGFGTIDVLINNAGIAGYHAVHDTPRDEWDRIVAVNQTGVLLGMRAVLPSMRRAGRGSIVNISSICGAAAVPGIAAYHATKGAVLTMTKNAAVTYAGDGIRANAILPGWIETPLTLAQEPEVNGRYLDATPMPHGGTPADIGWAAVYLASDEARFVTGIGLAVDGGYLAQ